MTKRLALRQWQLVILLAIFASACFAQTENPKFRVVVQHIKPDMYNEWRDMQINEVLPALKKAGVKSHTVYRNFFGDTWEFVTIEPIDKYADFDSPSPLAKALEPAPLARLAAKLNKCVSSSTSYVITRQADLMNPSEAPMPVMVSTRYRVNPGKMEDFRNIVKNDYLPVYKKAKANLLVNQRGFGANPNDVTVSTGYPNMAALDAGPVLIRELGSEAANKVLAKFVGIATPIERLVRRRVAELSF